MESAVRFHEGAGRFLLEDGRFQALLGDLDRSIGETQKGMADSGVTKECADCAVNGEGTCCGIRTGDKCSNIILFINLAMGRVLPRAAADPRLCHFLTTEGCSLRCRPVICVNFTCRRLRDAIPHEALCNIQEIAGREIDALFALEEYIKKKIVGGALLGTHT